MLSPDLEVMKEKWRAMRSPFAESWDWIDIDIRETTPRVGHWINTTDFTRVEAVNEILQRLPQSVVR